MSFENQEMIKEIFLAAIKLAPRERARFLAENCPDENTRVGVDALIRQAEDTSGQADSSAIEEHAAGFSDNSPDDDSLTGRHTGGKIPIAVLPLKLFGAPTGSHDDEYLGVGLADAIITRISGVRRIVVRPTSSILRFGDAEDAFAAGRQLKVDFVLSGTVRHARERIRVSVQLVEIKRERTL